MGSPSLGGVSRTLTVRHGVGGNSHGSTEGSEDEGQSAVGPERRKSSFPPEVVLDVKPNFDGGFAFRGDKEHPGTECVPTLCV